VFPRPSELREIAADALDALGPRARAVMTDIPTGYADRSLPAAHETQRAA
jgi:hypothetical protein